MQVYGIEASLGLLGRRSQSLHHPQDLYLEPDDESEFVMIGDEAFLLQSNLLRPYLGRDLDTMTKNRYNYRLSRVFSLELAVL